MWDALGHDICYLAFFTFRAHWTPVFPWLGLVRESDVGSEVEMGFATRSGPLKSGRVIDRATRTCHSFILK